MSRTSYYSCCISWCLTYTTCSSLWLKVAVSSTAAVVVILAAAAHVPRTYYATTPAVRTSCWCRARLITCSSLWPKVAMSSTAAVYVLPLLPGSTVWWRTHTHRSQITQLSRRLIYMYVIGGCPVHETNETATYCNPNHNNPMNNQPYS